MGREAESGAPEEMVAGECLVGNSEGVHGSWVKPAAEPDPVGKSEACSAQWL